MKHDLIIIGAGGHAKVLIDALDGCSELNVLGLIDNDEALIGSTFSGLKILGNDTYLNELNASKIKLVNAIGSINETSKRTDIYNNWISKGFGFCNVIHPSAIVSKNTDMGQGCQIMASATLQPGVTLNNNVIINTKASVDHDCSIGNHVHIAPGAILSGDVKVGDGTHIGTGAVIIQGVTIGNNCFVAAGAVVTSDIADNMRVAGIPARSL